MLRLTLCLPWFNFFMSISENLAAVRERVHKAARRAGRSSEEITLMAVSKTQPAERIREAYSAGQRLFGENRVQEFGFKAEAMQDLKDAEWHMIGHLQSNKAAKTAELFRAVDSVDSVKLAEKLDASARALGRTLGVLIEINVGGEAVKSGVAPDSHELEELLLAAPRLKALVFRGLMTVPPFTDDPKVHVPTSASCASCGMRLLTRRLASVAMDQLSMGMSHDFEVAIEEGSTCVRVGTAIFGERMKA